MNQMLRFGIILAVICLTATLVLALTYEITRPKIDAELKREETEALKEISPAADSFVEKSVGGIEYFEARKGSNLIGYCARVATTGYNGFIRIIAAVDLNGAITGIRVLEHQETPGLGAKISEIKPGEKDPWFTRQFIGKSARTVEVKKDIDAITGATISSRAVTEAVKRTISGLLSEVKR